MGEGVDPTLHAHASVSASCRNISGRWRPAGASLARRYAHTALREGAVYDLVQPVNFRLARKSKPWHWQRNGSEVPSLLVFGEDVRGAPRDDRTNPASQHEPLPLADEIDWPSAVLGRVVIFVGDSLASHQANNLLLLASPACEGFVWRSDVHRR